MLLIVPSLDANKQWGGLVSTYYVARVECYERSFAKSAGNGTSTLNYAHYNKCIDDASWAFQHNLGGPGRGARGNRTVPAKILILLILSQLSIKKFL